jgi:hypothetical protein
MHCFDLFMLIDGNAVSCLSSAFFQKDKSLLRYWICIRSWLVVMTFSDRLLCIAYVECLVGGFKHFLFSIIYGIIIPTDQYFSEGLKPPTRCLFYGVVMTVCCEMTSRFGWFSPAHPSEESHGGESGAAIEPESGDWNGHGKNHWVLSLNGMVHLLRIGWIRANLRLPMMF